MELTNEFRVTAPIDRVWDVLTDVEQIAPCLPGAELQEIDGEEYRGIVKVKVGPITAQYKGAAHFVELEPEERRAVLLAQGRETRGQGNASATITAQLEADGDGTRVSVVTDLMITGRVAQFGRGVMADVSTKLLAQFAASLEQLLRSEPGAPPPSSGSAEPVDLLDAAAAPVARRVAPIAAVTVVTLWLLRRRRRRRRSRRSHRQA